MKTRSKILVAGSAVLAVVLLSGFRGAGGPGWGERNPERMRQFITWRMEDKLTELKASEQQKQALLGLKDQLFEEGKGLHEGQKAARTELLAQWESINPDSQRVHQLVDERMESFRAFAHRMADAALEAHRILSPQQRQALTQEYRERTGTR
jgi:periplasmic protein CpxP/Spy